MQKLRVVVAGCGIGREHIRALQTPVSYTHLDVYKRQVSILSKAVSGEVGAGDGGSFGDKLRNGLVAMSKNSAIRSATVWFLSLIHI